jgi:hypothetical protein
MKHGPLNVKYSEWFGVSLNYRASRVLKIILLPMRPLQSTSYADCGVKDSWQKLALFAESVYIFITSANLTK